MKKENEKILGKGIKKPQFIVFTDKDGTLNLEDTHLGNIIALITVMGGMIVPTTGRTVGDIKEDFKKRKITLPQIIVGDNGANVYSTATGEFIIKKTIETEKVNKIIEFFIQHGGNPDFIRYTDGTDIYASKRKSVREYYKKNKKVKLFEDIKKKILDSDEITKITLAGSKEEMKAVSEYVATLGFWTDMDKTKFPEKEDENYRLDIAEKNINKGNAVKGIVNYFKPQYGYMCVGNGYNDMSMFKRAIDDGMIAAVMEESDSKLIEEVQKYADEKKKGKIVIVPKDENKANRLIFKRAKILQSYIRSHQFDIKKNRLPNVERVTVKSLPPKKKNKMPVRNKGNIER